MFRIAFRTLFTTSALAGLTLVGACAGPSGATSAPPLRMMTGHLDLVGSKWKLPMSDSGLDGRTIEFRMGENHTYHGVLTNVGRQLDKKVGAYVGFVLMELVPTTDPTSFQGLGRTPGSDNEEITCSVTADGGRMKCNIESTPWERI